MASENAGTIGLVATRVAPALALIGIARHGRGPWQTLVVILYGMATSTPGKSMSRRGASRNILGERRCPIH